MGGRTVEIPGLLGIEPIDKSCWSIEIPSWRSGSPPSVESSEALAVEVSCSDHSLTVVLDDGRTVSVPLVWFPRLLAAIPQQRKDWEPIGGGIGIHWEAIDEDISIASLLRPEKFMLSNVLCGFPRSGGRVLCVQGVRSYVSGQG